MQALIWFSMSNEYNNIFDTGKKGSFDLKEADEKINESIKKVIGDEVDYSNKDVVSRALMWVQLISFYRIKNFQRKNKSYLKRILVINELKVCLIYENG